MADTNKQMAEFARELWENYIKPKYIAEFSDNVTYYMATVVSNDGNNRVTIRRPFDDPYQVSCLEDMAGLVAGDTVLVLRFGNGTNNANHIIFGKGNGNTNYTAAEATELANAAIKTIEYGVGTSPTSHSDITSWSSDTPQWEAGKYIWQRTSTNDSTYTYTCIQGAAGQPGAAGYNTATVYLYQRATSTPSNPTNNLTYTFSTATLTGTIDNDWDTVIPTGTNPIYVIAATAFSDTDTDLITTSDWSSPVILAQNGTNGSPGTNGINTATVYLYQRKATIPNKPSNTLTYTFATGALTGTIDNDWATTIPSGTDPLFVTFATAASATTTDTIDPSEWVTPEILAENGEDGADGTDGTDGTDGKDGQMLYATSTSAATTVGKTATLTSGTLTLEAGATVAVTFTHKNTAASPTLNVSSTGAKTIRAAGADLTATSPYNWTDGATVTLVYDGTYWQMDGTASLLKANNAAKTATDYITDVGSTGIEVTGNNATSKVQIEDTVKVIADSTHYTEVTSSGFDIYEGRTIPVARIRSYTSGSDTFSVLGFSDYAGDNSLAIIGARTSNDGYDYGFVQTRDPDNSPLTYTAVATTIDPISGDAVPVGGATIWYSLANNASAAWMRCYADGRGELILYYGSDPNYYMAVLGRVTISNASGTVINDEPALVLYNSAGAVKSAYAMTGAYINSGTQAGFAAHGRTIAHRLTFDFDTISGYNYLRFWIDGTEIARIQQQSYSDERVKTDIEPIKEKYKEAAAAVDIDQFRYDFGDPVRQGAYGVMFGIVAQDLIKELDDRKIRFEDTPLVSNTDNDDESLYSVDYTQFLLARIAADEDRIKALEVENTELKKRLDAIEEAVAKLA